MRKVAAFRDLKAKSAAPGSRACKATRDSDFKERPALREIRATVVWLAMLVCKDSKARRRLVFRVIKESPASAFRACRDLMAHREFREKVLRAARDSKGLDSRVQLAPRGQRVLVLKDHKAFKEQGLKVPRELLVHRASGCKDFKASLAFREIRVTKASDSRGRLVHRASDCRAFKDPSASREIKAPKASATRAIKVTLVHRDLAFKACRASPE